ncbi:MAG: cadherin repeat domain-containing protein [Eubacterium sp.]|nr:cadherin repeat domain-containing protein [Eubacterium sp.]
MKKVLSLVLSLLMITSALSALPFTALAKGDIPNVQLSSDNILTWDEYEGATKYWIRFGASYGFEPDSRTVDLNQKAFENGFTTGTYDFTLVACVENWQEISNPYSGSFYYEATNVLDAPSNPRWDGLVARWDSVENADYYQVRIYAFDGENYTYKGYQYSSDYNYLDFSSNVNLVKSTNYAFKVYACAKTVYGPSELSAYSDVVPGWLDKQEIKNVKITDEGILSWDEYEGAAKYWIRFGADAFEPEGLSANLVERAKSMELDCGAYNVSVVACDNSWGDLSIQTYATYNLHYWDGGNVTKAPTCTEKGEKVLTCTKCGETKKTELPAKGHTPKEAVKENGVAATYAHAGSYESVVYCSVCGGEISRKKVTVPQLHKKKNPITVKAKKCTVDFVKLNNKNQTIALKKAMTVSKAKGTLTFFKKSGNKKITINKKTGNITVKKGLKKGTYKVKIKVKAAGNTTYKAGSKTVTVTIKVK